MPKRWVEVTARGPAERKDEAAALMIEAGSPGVLEDEPFAAPADEGDGAPSPVAALKSFLAGDDAVSGLGASLRAIGWTFETSPYRDVDWTERWKRWIRPVKVAARGVEGRIIVKPTWRSVESGERDAVIEIDPAMAFGTGSHPTTRMCLRAMLSVIGRGRAVGSFLDVGTGSGVLAIAACRLGVGRVTALDIDPEALRAARLNRRLNSVSFTVSALPLGRIRGLYDMVAANIISGELVRLAPQLGRRLAPGGLLLLSGILRDECRGVRRRFEELGLRHVRTLRSAEWAALLLAGPSSS
ncbi:MAG TPA: 50S ribosomal protein L11 methyltransferase [Deltaproteobacteria bacterium]|nr:50S ribosomal protein L11 methyltransferase [Deltaproteobacteria bacterium]